MAKLKLSSFDTVNWVLIVRDATGAHINGTGSRGGFEYAKGLAYSIQRGRRAPLTVSLMAPLSSKTDRTLLDVLECADWQEVWQ